jgi:hypothetical protein
MAFIITGVVVSCAGMKGSTENKISAQIKLDYVIFQIKSGIIDIDTMNDEEYISIGYKVCNLISIVDRISKSEHYFRNYFSRAPLTLDEMIETIQKNESPFKWKLVTPNNSIFHMFGKDGEYNTKFISEDGHFEAVYNKSGKLVTEKNDPLNMGTFNYADQVNEKTKHLEFDIMPYFKWGNSKNDSRHYMSIDSNTDDNIEPEDFNSNQDAVERYKRIYKEIYGTEYVQILE